MSLEAIEKALVASEGACGVKINYGVRCGQLDNRCATCGEIAKLVKALRVAVGRLQPIAEVFEGEPVGDGAKAAIDKIASILESQP